MTRTHTRQGHARPGAAADGSKDRRERFTLTQALILALCALAVATAFFYAVQAPALGERPDGPWRQVLVAPAQTLWDIALQHPVDGLTTQETVRLLQDMNDLDSPQVRAGQSIHVPSPQTAGTAVAAR